MINLGIIGTNWITDQFVQAAHETGKYRLAAVYSRRLDTAQKFGEKYGDVEYATDLDTFFGLEHVNTVYIASPNSLHFEQAKQGILAGKNVIVEKPAFSTPTEMMKLLSWRIRKEYFSLKRLLIFMRNLSKRLLIFYHRKIKSSARILAL